MLNVACISVDRAVAITCPLRYEDIVTRERATRILCAVWSYCALILLTSLLRIPITDETYGIFELYMGFALTYFIPITIILVSYSTIIASTVKNLKFTDRYDRLYYCFSGNNTNASRIRKKLMRELRVTGNIMILVVPFTIGWSYFIISQVYEEVHEYIDSFDHDVMMVVIPWLLSGLNPILYFLLTRSIREGFVHLFKRYSRNYSLNTTSCGRTSRRSKNSTSSIVTTAVRRKTTQISLNAHFFSSV